MQKKNEDCQKNLKAKEVITTLCRFLSALDAEFVPTPEMFRRAKFNKPDATQDLWRLLSSVIMKVFEPICACSEPSKHSTSDSELCLVKSALWYAGYGSWWVVGPWTCESREEVGSRDLLLAFSWFIASGNLLETLLRERLLQLDVLSSAAAATAEGLWNLGPPEGLKLDINGCGEKDIRSLQWQYGKLKLQWRNLLSAQQEQVKLADKIFSHVNIPSSCYPSTAHGSNLTGSSALEKDIARIQSLNGILEAYLEWKNVEPMFWCWMDSVMDGYLSDGYKERPVDVLLKDLTVTQSCSHSDKVWRSVKCLDKMLQNLQTKRKDGLDRCVDTTQLSRSQKEEVENRVSAQLQGFSLVNTPTAIDRGFIPYFQEPQASKSTGKPQHGDSQTLGTLQASSVIKELRNRKAILEWELELLRHKQREEIQLKANELEGLVFMLPLKR